CASPPTGIGWYFDVW
nr:immunoglobulin heavy chain junction region [Mus musculus]